MILSSPLAVTVDGGVHPLLSAFSAAALAGYVVAALLGGPREAWARTALAGGWIAQAAAIAVDLGGAGHLREGARFGFGPVLSVTLWLVLAVYWVESRVVPMSSARRPLAMAAAVAVLVAWVFPADLRPNVPSVWAPLHWVLGMASYGLFGVAVLHGVLLNRAEQRLRERTPGAPPPGVPLLRLERLTFDFILAGFVALSAALVAGWWVASPWRWDHKTVFSVLAWLVFAGLLAGRRVLGWRGTQATRWLYAGATLLLLAYVGSRFVVEVLLVRAAG
jgi:ABC-type uncharacterized transport system permease subunit